MKRDDIRGLFPNQLNGLTAKCIGKAACMLLQAKGIQSPTMAVGHDCRHGNVEIAQGFMLGFREAGGKCVYLGTVSTEHVYFSCGEHADRFDAGAMVTASHNPREYNGIKMVHSGCLPFSQEDLAFIAQRTDELLSLDTPEMDFEEYARHMLSLTELINRPDSDAVKFTIVVLAGNGMGAVAFAPIARLLEQKGLKSIILEGEPDGDFPQGVPNPLLPDFMKRLGAKVLEHHADLGIGFDGDADRAGFVDSTGAEIIPSQVLALIAEAKLARSANDAPVVMRNLCCSQLIADLFPAGGKATLVDTPVGHGRIKQLMRCEAYRNRTVFAGEHSGHYFYPEFNYVDSGVLTSLNMLSIVWGMAERGESLPARLSAWRKRYVWSGELNYELASKEATRQALVKVWQATQAPGIQRFEARQDTACGAQRIFASDAPYDPAVIAAPDLKMLSRKGDSGWWFVLRPSGNEPKLRLNVEAWGEDAKAVCQAKVKEVEALIHG